MFVAELTGKDGMSSCGSNNGGCISANLCLPGSEYYYLCACPSNGGAGCSEYCELFLKLKIIIIIG